MTRTLFLQAPSNQQALENGWLDEARSARHDERGVQIVPLRYRHLGHSEIFHSIEDFYRRFDFRAPKVASIASQMIRSLRLLKRRAREGLEFLRFLRDRRERVR